MSPLHFALRAARRALKPFDVAIERSSQSYEVSRATILRRAGINLLFDVGANAGQYARSVRQSGYRGEILSIEPIPKCFSAMSASFAGDRLWSGVQAAAGAVGGKTTFNVSEDLVTSSILSPSSDLMRSIPSSRITDTIEVDIITVDDLWSQRQKPSDQSVVPALKVDVQGFEKHVLRGAKELLSEARLLEVELSVMHTYEDGYSVAEGLPYISSLGFRLVSLGRGHSDLTTGTLTDADMLFIRD